MTNNQLTDERVTSVIERLEHYACNLKWTNVRGAQDLLTAADGLRELQERRKADSEPVAEVYQAPNVGICAALGPSIRMLCPLEPGTKLYLHAQPALVAPVCTCPSGDGSLRWPCPVHPGNSPVIPDGWTGNEKANAALMMLDRIETVDPVDDDRIDGIKRIVRELATAPHDTPALNSVQSVDSVADRWIPVSERMPIEFEAVIAFDGDQVYGEAMYSSDDGFTIDGYDPCDRLNLQNVTHWMPLPAAPQEVK